MTIRRLAFRAFRLPLARPLETAHGAIAERCGHLVRVEDADGLVGFGEATPLPEFGTEDLVKSGRALETAIASMISSWVQRVRIVGLAISLPKLVESISSPEPALSTPWIPRMLSP